MIKEIFEKIRERLLGLGIIKHVDLWNRNVEFIEQEEAWERPAVFIEFEPVKWECVEPGYEYHANPRIRLHIVTDWATDEADETTMEQLELPVRIHGALSGMSGDCFCGLDIEESHTNHDHEEILDSVDVYSCDASRILG